VKSYGNFFFLIHPYTHPSYFTYLVRRYDHDALHDEGQFEKKNNNCHKRKVKDGYSPLALAILDGVDDTVIAVFVSAVMLDTDVHSPFLCFKDTERWTHPNHAAHHTYIVRVYYYANVRLFFFLSTQVVFQ
jgi:hypothetical protein